MGARTFPPAAPARAGGVMRHYPSAKDLAKITKPGRYAVVDSTGKTIPEVVSEIEKRVRETGGI